MCRELRALTECWCRTHCVSNRSDRRYEDFSQKRGTLLTRQHGLVFGKVAITFALLAFLAARIDGGALAQNFAHAHLADLALAVAILFLSYPLGGLRWWCVLKGLGQSAPMGLLIGLFWLGGLFSQVLPNPLGDGLRVSIAVRRGVRLTVALRSAVFERVIMVVALLLLVAATEPMLRGAVGDAAPTWLSWILLAMTLSGLGLLLTADRVVAKATALPLIRGLAAWSSDFRRLMSSRWSIAVYATSLFAHINLIVSAALVGWSLDLPLTALNYLAIMPIATVAMVIPISVGGWGVREGVLIAVLGAMGVPQATALTFSLMFGAVVALSSLPAASLLWLREPSASVRATPDARGRSE
jgi:uncharacterized membrane protein YbhN (UPF0104 family)